jgi:hypothetical protein
MIETMPIVKMKRMMNIQLIVYKIAQIIQMIDKISKNEIEMIVWALIPFLMMNDECRNFSIEMMNHCRNYVTLLKFLKMMIEIFPEFLIEMKMKMIVWENLSLLIIRETDVSLMIVKVIFLSEVIVLLAIDLEMIILEISISFEIEMSIEI